MHVDADPFCWWPAGSNSISFEDAQFFQFAKRSFQRQTILSSPVNSFAQ